MAAGCANPRTGDRAALEPLCSQRQWQERYSSTLLNRTLTPTPQAEYGHDFNIAFYNAYIGVTIMMLVGFGYLMAFLKCYGLGAVGFTFVITCLALQAQTHTKTDTPSYPSTPILPSRKPTPP